MESRLPNIAAVFMWGPDSPERQAQLWPCPVIEEKIRTEIICLFLTAILIFCAPLRRTRRPQKGAENLSYWDWKFACLFFNTWNSNMNIWQHWHLLKWNFNCGHHTPEIQAYTRFSACLYFSAKILFLLQHHIIDIKLLKFITFRLPRFQYELFLKN